MSIANAVLPAKMGHMPLYDFECPKCDHRYEELAPVGKLAPCPLCGHKKPALRISCFSMPRMGALPAIQELERGPQPVTQAPPRRRGVTTMINCSAHGCGIGVQIGQGAHVVSHGLRVTGAETGVKNEGTFEHTDTVIR